MTDQILDGPDDDPELRAAEYVLGVLDTEAQAAAAAECAADPRFAAMVAHWEQRLAPLGAAVAPVAPPAYLFGRIAASLPSPPPARPGLLARLWGSAAVWRGATLAATLAAAAFAGLAYLRPPPASLTAVLTASGSTSAVFLAQVQADGSILIRPTGQVNVAPAHDLELWALPKGATVPVSLGVLPDRGAVIQARAQPDTQLLVSLEPKGGSPSGAPTGPVVYGGRLDPFR